MYKGHPIANKVLQKLQQQKIRQSHRINLKSIRPTTCLPTRKQSSVTLNPRKKEMQSQTRCTEIQRQNRLLLTKITSIMNKRKQSGDSRSNGSLNSSLRKRQFQSIQVENAKMLKRLQSRKSDYELGRFRKEWKKTQHVLKNITSYPVIEQIAGKRRRRAPVDFEQLKQITSHNPEDFTLSKIRLIGNKKFIITVKFTDNKCVVLGDLKSEEELKVIQIDKGQALEFIEEYCGGNIHKMFDKLTYDEQQGTLNLNGDNPDLSEDGTLQQAKKGKKSEGIRQRRKMSHKPLYQCVDYTAFNKQDLLF